MAEIWDCLPRQLARMCLPPVLRMSKNDRAFRKMLDFMMARSIAFVIGS